jgi:subtilisin-like proprotein convertase family protein
MCKFKFLLLSFCWIATQLTAQTPGFFKAVSDAEIRQTGLSTSVQSNEYKTYQLDHAALKAQLWTAPMEFTADARAARCVIELPLADGTTEAFAIWETAMLEPNLAAEHPYIKTFAGRSMRNASRTVRMSYTAWGFRAMVMQPNLGAVYVEPYSWGQETYYIVYDYANLRPDPVYLKDRPFIPGDAPSAMQMPDERLFAPEMEDRGAVIEPVQLKVYRYIVATTGEFSEDHGGTKPLVFSKVVEYTNMVSGFFERDIAMRLQLISPSQNVVFLNPNTDPYTGTEVGDWMSQNPGVLDFYASVNSHDVGHVYARYLGGSAIGVAGGITCTDGKGRGCSAGTGNNDYGAYFVSVIGQEVGHQMSGGHTWNRCSGGGGRNGITAFEPGSGSTIMSYAGSCGTDNIQGTSDLYYHGGSIEEIRNFYTYYSGAACGTFSTTDNSAPVVNLAYTNNFFIPISTPFELNGTASDPDGDPLVFNWEEVDAGPETALGFPSGNAATFRTLPAVPETNRYFPKLSTVINNQTSSSEQLPTYTRDLTFRLTARDNRPNGGGVGWADVAFKAWEGAGPFVVTSPNASSDIWRVGEYVNVVWDVANTDQLPVNCQRVNIRLSTDGGLSYPIVLSEQAVNDGSQLVLVPNNLSNTCRVRVDAADNVFYDISNTNFKIQNPVQPSFTFGLSTDVNTICLPNTFSSNILSAGVLGFNSQVILGYTGELPPGALLSFSDTEIAAGEPSTLTIDLENVAVNGTYSFNVWAYVAATDDTLYRPVTLTLLRNDFTDMAQLLPQDGATNLGLNQVVYWSKGLDADSYDVQLSKSPAFDVLVSAKVATVLDTFKIPQLLEKNTAYYWRIRPRNECGIGSWTDPFFFSTYAESCSVLQANDLPKSIAAGSAPTIESVINVNGGGTISDLNIKVIDGFHDWFSDLEARLISPAGTNVLLFKNKCGNTSTSFEFAMDDDAAGFPCPPPNNGVSIKPQTPLNPFLGQNTTGAWILRIKDNVIGSGGALSNFKLEFCASVNVLPPYLIKNEILYIAPGLNEAITNTLLEVGDPDNTAGQLVYTLVSKPLYGQLEKNLGGPLVPGATFTQQDINSGALRYFDYGLQQPEDYFKFSVSDGNGGFLATPVFRIKSTSVGALDPSDNHLRFSLFPNPATGAVRITISEPLALETRVTLLEITGRMVLNTSLQAGVDHLNIPLKDLPKGLYFVRLENDGQLGVQKLMIR